jgi:hypothetical protein
MSSPVDAEAAVAPAAQATAPIDPSAASAAPHAGAVDSEPASLREQPGVDVASKGESGDVRAGHSADAGASTDAPAAESSETAAPRLRKAQYHKLNDLRPGTVGSNFVLRVQEKMVRERCALVGDETACILFAYTNRG